MELRHFRYFIAVAEEGSLTNAAERRLHTAQPSLSRQIRDLELEIGVKLIERRARGIALTAAGRVFLDHARHVWDQPGIRPAVRLNFDKVTKCRTLALGAEERLDRPF